MKEYQGTVESVDEENGWVAIQRDRKYATSHDPRIGQARRWLEGIAEMLEEKNAAYGNSALDPLRVFSRAGTIEQIKVRIDDKLSRMARGNGCASEDTLRDLAGYLALLAVALAPEAKADPEPGEKPKADVIGFLESRRRWRELEERRSRAMLILEAHGCDCECEHGATEHDEHCRRCLACRIEQALTAPMGEP